MVYVKTIILYVNVLFCFSTALDKGWVAETSSTVSNLISNYLGLSYAQRSLHVGVVIYISTELLENIK